MKYLLLALIIACYFWSQSSVTYHYHLHDKSKSNYILLAPETRQSDINKPDAAQSHNIPPADVSYYAKGLKHPEAYTAACWDTYPEGSRFLVSYNHASVVVTCNDRGHFQQMGRFLDLSAGAFEQLSPLSVGILHHTRIELIP